MKYRRISTTIEAEQFTDLQNPPKGVTLWNEQNYHSYAFGPGTHGFVTTIHDGLEGKRIANVKLGDWIMPEPDGIHFYPCAPEVFAKTYEPALEMPKIPEGICYSPEHEKFYQCGTNRGMGHVFFQQWNDLRAFFPTELDGLVIQRIRELAVIQGAPGVAETCAENLGFANGLECALAMLENREPKLRRPPDADQQPESFREALTVLINYYSLEGAGRGGDTPDFILAQFLVDTLAAFDRATVQRANWYGKGDPTPASVPSEQFILDGIPAAKYPSGFFYSPYGFETKSEADRFAIDCRGFAPGMLVLDFASGKKFRLGMTTPAQ